MADGKPLVNCLWLEKFQKPWILETVKVMVSLEEDEGVKRIDDDSVKQIEKDF